MTTSIVLPRAHSATRVERAPRALAKGEQTRAEIVAVALGMAARVGLEGLSIG
ncbi:MAG TPA: TetR/AcrR family transcriptional regulator, partial [Ottowia sp.]|nr:TetR/AcrR family transcriptional regulator [Ottowia sp.]